MTTTRNSIDSFVSTRPDKGGPFWMIFGVQDTRKTRLLASILDVPELQPFLYIDREGGTDSVWDYMWRDENPLRVLELIGERSSWRWIGEKLPPLIAASNYKCIGIDSLSSIVFACEREIVRQHLAAYKRANKSGEADDHGETPCLRCHGVVVTQMKGWLDELQEDARKNKRWYVFTGWERTFETKNAKGDVLSRRVSVDFRPEFNRMVRHVFSVIAQMSVTYGLAKDDKNRPIMGSHVPIISARLGNRGEIWTKKRAVGFPMEHTFSGKSPQFSELYAFYILGANSPVVNEDSN